MAIIEVKHLTKKYDQHLAVNDISFSVEEGELFALLGENGAGKSTTIHILCTILEKSQGDICICGYLLGREDDQIRKNIGIVFQNSVLDPKLTVQENLMTRGSFYGMKKVEIQRRLAEFETYFEMQSLWKKPYGTLSGGQKRRVDICRSLIHDPRILFLDEPTTGLDPKNRKLVWEYIHFLRKEKKDDHFFNNPLYGRNLPCGSCCHFGSRKDHVSGYAFSFKGSFCPSSFSLVHPTKS